jgi:hypothetical protein
MDIQAQAAKSAQQGQQMLAEDRAKSSSASNQYNNFTNQATTANKNLQAQAKYMQGAGSGENTYNRTLAQQESNVGFNPQQLSDANKSLFSMSGAMNSANQQFNTPGGVGAYGMSAPSLASYEGSILNPLQTGVANANTQVGALNTELGTLQTGASQATSANVQGEQNTVTALSNAVTNYQAQASAALQNMQYYSGLASQQGGLNASMQKDYAASVQAYAAAKQSEAQASLFLSQAAGQNLSNQQTQAAMDASKKAPAPPRPNVTKPAPAARPAPASTGQGGFGDFMSGLTHGIGNVINAPISWLTGIS